MTMHARIDAAERGILGGVVGLNAKQKCEIQEPLGKTTLHLRDGGIGESFQHDPLLKPCKRGAISNTEMYGPYFSIMQRCTNSSNKNVCHVHLLIVIYVILLLKLEDKIPDKKCTGVQLSTRW